MKNKNRASKTENNPISYDREQDGVIKDPTTNVQNLLHAAVIRQDDLRHADTSWLRHDVESETKRLDEKIKDTKEYFNLRVDDTITMSNQRFEAQQLALKDALIAQEKAVAAALEGTKEAIVKNDANTDKRFDLLSEKMDGIAEIMSKNVGAQGIYVTHTDLSAAVEKLQLAIELQLRPVVTFMNNQTGRGGGQKDLTGWIIGGVMFIIAIVSFIIPYLKTP